MIEYKNYRLSRMIAVQDLVSADYFRGRLPHSIVHTHENAWELCVCMEGSLSVVKNDRTLLLGAGEIIFIHPQTRHEVLSDDRNSAGFVLCFTCTGDHLRPLQDSIISIPSEMTDLLHTLIGELKTSFLHTRDALRLSSFVPREDPPLGAEQLICTYLEQFLILLLRQVTMQKGTVVTEGRLKHAMQSYLAQQVQTYIREHLSEPLSVEKIAAHFHYSRTHLSALFKATVGISVGEYIVFARISAAKILLLERKKTVAQIAEETGFTSPQYFSHKFAREVGCSPSKFAELVERSETL